ncbi:trans-acting enoyl reductase family protein [Halorubrum gandharaense]
MTLLIYGAYGFTGELVAREAVDRGLDPILAGRDGDALRELGRELRCSVREFDLQFPETVTESVRDVDAVLNCAGPFAATATQLADACLETRTHYLDVTGEIDVFEALDEWDTPAADAGVTLLPGVGFDVVPTDCVAARLAEALPEATHLELAFATGGGGGVSRGTARTAIRGLGEGSVVREDGDIRQIPLGSRSRRVAFGSGDGEGAGGGSESNGDTREYDTVAVPWGDVSTAYHTTGIPNVTVYAAVPPRARRLIRLARPLSPVLRTRPVRWLLDRIVRSRVDGPSPAERADAEVLVWGEARNAATGETVTARLRTGDPYEFTAASAVTAAERVLAGEGPNGVAVPDGFTTPAGAFGWRFVETVDGVKWRTVP